MEFGSRTDEAIPWSSVAVHTEGEDDDISPVKPFRSNDALEPGDGSDGFGAADPFNQNDDDQVDQGTTAPTTAPGDLFQTRAGETDAPDAENPNDDAHMVSANEDLTMNAADGEEEVATLFDLYDEESEARMERLVAVTVSRRRRELARSTLQLWRSVVFEAKHHGAPLGLLGQALCRSLRSLHPLWLVLGVATLAMMVAAFNQNSTIHNQRHVEAMGEHRHVESLVHTITTNMGQMATGMTRAFAGKEQNGPANGSGSSRDNSLIDLP